MIKSENLIRAIQDRIVRWKAVETYARPLEAKRRAARLYTIQGIKGAKVVKMRIGYQVRVWELQKGAL